MVSKERRVFLPGLAGLLLASMTGIGLGARNVESRPLDIHPSQGQIDGMTAVTVMPRQVGASGFLPPWGYRAHLTGHDDPAVEITFPCGTWSQPPAGRYRVWVEGTWTISPLTHIISFSSRPFQGSGMITSASTVDAGRVALPPAFKRDRDNTLRLLHGGEYLDEGFPRFELSRRHPIGEVGDGLLMPTGFSIGALWNERSESYVALSRPFQVKHRETVLAPLEVPRKNEAHLVVQIQRATGARNPSEMNLKISIFRAGRVMLPDFQVSTADRAYAFWYGLEPGSVEVRAEAASGSFQPQRIVLEAGDISRFWGKMAETPQWARRPAP